MPRVTTGGEAGRPRVTTGGEAGHAYRKYTACSWKTLGVTYGPEGGTYLR